MPPRQTVSPRAVASDGEAGAGNTGRGESSKSSGKLQTSFPRRSEKGHRSRSRASDVVECEKLMFLVSQALFLAFYLPNQAELIRTKAIPTSKGEGRKEPKNTLTRIVQSPGPLREGTHCSGFRGRACCDAKKVMFTAPKLSRGEGWPGCCGPIELVMMASQRVDQAGGPAVGTSQRRHPSSSGARLRGGWYWDSSRAQGCCLGQTSPPGVWRVALPSAILSVREARPENRRGRAPGC